MNILITGASGYMASALSFHLHALGHTVFGIDLVTPQKREHFAKFYAGDFGNMALIRSILRDQRIECVIHAGSNQHNTTDVFARYFNDVTGSTFLLKTILQENIKKFIFLSSAQVYGRASCFPISEHTPTLPIDLEGMAKLAIEHLLANLSIPYDFHYAVFRLFNVTGTSQKWAHHTPPDDIISQLLRQDQFTIIGNNLPTADGTAELDFIHIDDAIRAIASILPKMNIARRTFCYNLASGRSYSIRDLIKIAQDVKNKDLMISEVEAPHEMIERLVAVPRLAQSELDWHLQFTDLKFIMGNTYSTLKKYGEI